MDQDTMVNAQTESGQRLIEKLAKTGFDVRVAFWAKKAESDLSKLYLISPSWEEKGLHASYLHVIELIGSMTDFWIDSSEVRLVGPRDSLAIAALALRDSRRFRGMIRYENRTLAGISFDWVYFYPPMLPVASAST